MSMTGGSGSSRPMLACCAAKRPVLRMLVRETPSGKTLNTYDSTRTVRITAPDGSVIYTNDHRLRNARIDQSDGLRVSVLPIQPDDLRT